jgi:hypothetical protein
VKRTYLRPLALAAVVLPAVVRRALDPERRPADAVLRPRALELRARDEDARLELVARRAVPRRAVVLRAVVLRAAGLRAVVRRDVEARRAGRRVVRLVDFPPLSTSSSSFVRVCTAFWTLDCSFFKLVRASVKWRRELAPAPLPAAARFFWIDFWSDSTCLLRLFSAAFPPPDRREAVVDLRAVLRRAVDPRAAVLRAGDFRAVAFRADELRALVLRAVVLPDLLAVPAVLRLDDLRAAGDISLLSLGGGGDVYFTRRMATQAIARRALYANRSSESSR